MRRNRGKVLTVQNKHILHISIVCL